MIKSIPQTKIVLGILLMGLFSGFFKSKVTAETVTATSAASQSKQTESHKTSQTVLEPLVDYAGLPLNAIDWLADRPDGKLLLEMPAPKGCTAAQLARNRLDWYVLPEEYDFDVELTVKGVMGYNLLSSNVESNSWRFQRFKGDKPIPLLYHEWAAERSENMVNNILGEPISANIQASIATGAQIISKLINTEVYFTNTRDTFINEGIWQFDYREEPTPQFVRLNVVPDYQTVKRRKSPLHFMPLAKDRKLEFIDDFMKGIDVFTQPGEKYDQLITAKPDPAGWTGSGTGTDTLKEDYTSGISYILNRDSVVFIKNIRPLLKIHGLLREYMAGLFTIAERVSPNVKARYTNFISRPSIYGNKEPLEVGGYNSLITESRIPLPGVSAFSYKPLDLMMLEAFSDPRVPSTENAKESYPVVEKLIKERLPIYRKRLAEIFAEDQRIADEAGLERDEGCEYSVEDWGDESLVSQVGQAEAERLGFAK